MFKLKIPEIYASEIAEFIQSDLVGQDFIVREPVSIKNMKRNSFTFLPEGKILEKDTLSDELLILCSNSIVVKNRFTYIISKNPLLDFIKVINEFFVEIETYKIAKTATIHPDAKIAHNVAIGENCVIGSDSVIGDNTQILNNVVLVGKVIIGNNCLIKDNSTIGSEGYDFIIDENGSTINFPHIGKIVIGNNVWIGSNTTIESPTIYDTFIGDQVKIDDLVQIGSGAIIEKGCMITAGNIISRNVLIKQKTWISPNATVIENIIIGKNCVVGAGSVILNDVADDVIIVGNPGRFLRNK